MGGFLGRAEGVLVRWGCGYDSDVLVIGGGSGYRLATRLAGCLVRHTGWAGRRQLASPPPANLPLLPPPSGPARRRTTRRGVDAAARRRQPAGLPSKQARWSYIRLITLHSPSLSFSWSPSPLARLSHSHYRLQPRTMPQTGQLPRRQPQRAPLVRAAPATV